MGIELLLATHHPIDDDHARYHTFASLFGQLVARGGTSVHDSSDIADTLLLDDDDDDRQVTPGHPTVQLFDIKLYSSASGCLIDYLLVCFKLSLRYLNVHNIDGTASIHACYNKLASRLWRQPQQLLQLAYLVWLDTYLTASIEQLQDEATASRLDDFYTTHQAPVKGESFGWMKPIKAVG